LRPDQISAGERKILSFIRATMNDPSLLFLDDPTLSVDPINSQRIREILQVYRKEKRTILMLTHDSELASQLADHMIVMDHAKIIASGPLNYVLQSKDKRTQDILAIFKGQVGSYSDSILDVLSNDQW
jgi:ABC-type multidrug transport system ATPase subunit